MTHAASPSPSPSSPWPAQTRPELEQRVLILAPTANDARLAAGFLQSAGLEPHVTAGITELCEKMLEGCGALLVAEEAILRADSARLFELLGCQPKWSDIPVTLVTTGSSRGEHASLRHHGLATDTNITMVERPFRPATLVRTVEVALRSRRRQYAVRQLLIDVAEARDQAEQASQAKDEFMAALSHELRTPLNPVLLIATEGANDPALPESVRSDFEQITHNVALEARLIDDLLDLTRITHGKLKLDLHPLDLHETLRLALETIGPEITEKQIVIEQRIAARRFIVRGDPVRLQQVFWNVLKNAAKFTPVRGRIRIETFDTPAGITVHVADTGVGMEASELGRVFDAFAQGNHAHHGVHRFGGLGLGLAISRRLVELHQGTITAHSEGPGQGATFMLTFPVAEGRAVGRGAKSARETTRPVSPQARRVLVVEDHAATRASMSRLLQKRGYEVATAETLAEARRHLAAGDFAVLLSDLGLPDGHGHELAPELRARPAMHAIALSGYGMETDLVQSREAGYIAHLTKPVTIQALDAILASVNRDQKASA